MVDGKVGIPKVGLQFFYYLKTLSHYVISKVLTFNFFFINAVLERNILGMVAEIFEESKVVIADLVQLS